MERRERYIFFLVYTFIVAQPVRLRFSYPPTATSAGCKPDTGPLLVIYWSWRRQAKTSARRCDPLPKGSRFLIRRKYARELIPLFTISSSVAMPKGRLTQAYIPGLVRFPTRFSQSRLRSGL